MKIPCQWLQAAPNGGGGGFRPSGGSVNSYLPELRPLPIRVENFNEIWQNPGMEKRTPHYALSRVKALIRQGAYRVTRTALQSATRDFGYIEASQLAECVLELNAKDFYKSMTTHNDATLWQDVYHPMLEETPAYVKVQVVDDTTVVISFKVLEDD